ncbi:putative epoxide hydrolase [Gordonia araii NBRC 100433]|uniref:Putative epoxide hydrolase n=1 Tax=Gordonia araii NBRC 100433 TaxID=1073574 RepID=G7GY28_9ACTN|nr:haloacid dehalogenase type II [Gordonia araii]GAB08503.1 putative epoxide hydrolase [Gordonia araii NBRC 100433]
MTDRPRPSALLFDLQGTATDFYTPVVAGLREAFPDADHDELLTRWRAGYFEQTGPEAPVDDAGWVSVHAIYRAALDEVLAEAGLQAGDDVCEALSRTWQRLEPWPDSIQGLSRLRSRYTTATLSNADVAAAVRICKHAALPFDAVFTAEMAGAFKPDPRAYLTAARYLDVPTSEIMMVACHKYDLRAAAELGLATAFVARPLEFGPAGSPDAEFDDAFTINATDFLDLADQLDC